MKFNISLFEYLNRSAKLLALFKKICELLFKSFFSTFEYDIILCTARIFLIIITYYTPQYIFIQLRCIKLIKSDSKHIYNVS